MSDREHWIPSPEELEEGNAPASQRRRRGGAEDTEQVRKGRLAAFKVKLGVGRSRKYEEVDTSPPTAVVVAEPSTLVEPEVETGGTRVESVKIRPQRRETPPAPEYPPYSKEAIFMRKASDKGHELGQISPIPHTTNYSAQCRRCGAEGVLVVQYEDNYANMTYEQYRGPAIERTCQA